WPLEALSPSKGLIMRHWAGVIETLAQIATKPDQPPMGLLGFYALGDNTAPKAFRQPQNRLDHHFALKIIVHIHHKRAINLDLLRRQSPEVVEGRIPGTKIVQRYFHTQSPAFTQGLDDLFGIIQSGGFQ